MGNCCMRHSHQSHMVWAGDNWGSPMSEKFIARETQHNGFSDDQKAKKMIRRMDEEETEQRSSLLVVDGDDHHKKNVMNSSTEVKVRITKKQLEELLGNVEVKGLSFQELLEQLMNVSTTDSTTKHRPWRPALQSIPEMIEAI